jgi:acetyltransferase-like isoleucine patch superfamily enzyme
MKNSFLFTELFFVNNDIPDYSIAVGTPAKVIKQYDSKTEQWIRI